MIAVKSVLSEEKANVRSFKTSKACLKKTLYSSFELSNATGTDSIQYNIIINIFLPHSVDYSSSVEPLPGECDLCNCCSVCSKICDCQRSFLETVEKLRDI